MGKVLVIVLLALAGGGGLLMLWPPGGTASPSGPTAVSVIVDFSGSFVGPADPAKLTGLRNEDARALNAVAEAVAEVASKFWHPPLKLVWTRIVGSSRLAEPLCAPLETDPRLVKPTGAIGTRQEIEQVLKECVERVVGESRKPQSHGPHTDISGAIAGAAEMAERGYSERVLVIFSDFREDLPPGARAAEFRLHGERVVMLHRPGTDEPEQVAGYLRRLEHWKKRLLSRGASSVAVLPVFGTANSRVRTALCPQDVPPGSALTLLADFKQPALSPRLTDSLRGMSKAIARLAEQWPAPVIAQWAAARPSGFLSQTMPLVEFGPSLIKRDNALNTFTDFAAALEELTHGLPALGLGAPVTDLTGSIMLATSIDPAPQRTVLVLFSDFAEKGSKAGSAVNLPPRTKVLMMHKPAGDDGPTPDRYVARRLEWEKRFSAAGAEVCQIQLATMTASDFISCLSNPQQGGQQ
jgi:hypothetical protein